MVSGHATALPSVSRVYPAFLLHVASVAAQHSMALCTAVWPSPQQQQLLQQPSSPHDMKGAMTSGDAVATEESDWGGVVVCSAAATSTTASSRATACWPSHGCSPSHYTSYDILIPGTFRYFGRRRALPCIHHRRPPPSSPSPFNSSLLHRLPFSMASISPSTLPLSSGEMSALLELLTTSTPVLMLLERRLPRPSPSELQAIQAEHRQQIVSGILESVAAVGMAGGAGLLIFHPFALIATAVVGAGALTGTVLVKLIWGTEDVNAAVIKAMGSPFYTPTRQPQLVDTVAMLGLLQRVAGRLRELPVGLRGRVQRAEFDENIDVSLLDKGRLQAVVNDVTSFLQDAGDLPAPAHIQRAAASPLSNGGPLPGPSSAASAGPSPPPPVSSAVQLEPAVVSFIVSSIIQRMLSKTDVDGRPRDAVTEVIVGPDALGLLLLSFDYKWDTKRSCMWRKVDLKMVRRVLWLTEGEVVRAALNALVWEGPPQGAEVEEEQEKQPEQAEQVHADTIEGEGAEGGGLARGDGGQEARLLG